MSTALSYSVRADHHVTLRDYLARRGLGVLIPAIVITVTAWVLVEHVPSLTRWKSAVHTVSPPFVILTVLLAQVFARCPRCGARLNYIDFGSRKWGTEPRIGLDRCTQCGLHLREELRDGECS